MIRRYSSLIRRAAIVCLLIPVLAAAMFIPPVSSEANDWKPERSSDTWIIKWTVNPHPDFWRETELLERHEELSVWVVRPKEAAEAESWFRRWSSDPGVDYLQMNQKVKVLAAPNDPLYANQLYLKQIHAPEAWDTVIDNPTLVVALIDTGVDMDHPDLQERLVEGVNLIDPNADPEDDHGHGTNVAGVVAAIGNNATGISGISMNTKIMPIKAIEADGLGDEDKLGEGIRYAVDEGAKIVVLSVGLHRYSPFLQEVAEYAEQKGVLLISASGNEGREVKYPAAFPTVLAVGGVSPDNRVMLESNYGPEIDLVAPWEVYTTAMGGGYTFNRGTSMAAPQAAGAAALIWAKYPDLKPFEVRNLLQQTAQDIESIGWDEYSGYGLLRVDRAVKEKYRTDMYEPNNRRDTAKRLPLDTMVYGELDSASDEDWFYIDAPYKGKVQFNMQEAMDANRSLPKVKMTLYAGDTAKGTEYADIANNPPLIQVPKGKSRLMIKHSDSTDSAAFRYKLKTDFLIYEDDFEDNDKQYKAYSIPSGQHSLVGTFHDINDQDWFSFQVVKSGSLQLTVTTDSMRMDLAVMVQKNGEKAYTVDAESEGGKESISAYDLSPGRYYILISNVISDYAYPVRGEYELEFQMVPKLIDPNEPNDKSYQAASALSGTIYFGLIDTVTDSDWFVISVASESYVSFRLRDIPDDKLMLMTLYDSKQKQMALNINSQGETGLYLNQVLPKGTYYVKLGANKAFVDKLYRFDVRIEQLVAGFRDIKGHWAEKTIADMVKARVVQGYSDYTFRPDRSITRAEGVVILVNALGFHGSRKSSFPDVPSDHWASAAIQTAVQAGIISGYEDGTFRPDVRLSRAEMAVMIAQGLGYKPAAAATATFTDVSSDHWAAGWLAKLSRDGLVNGYLDGTFLPDNTATRAEMVVMAAKAARR